MAKRSDRRRHSASHTRAQSNNNTLIIAAVAVAVLFVGGLIALNVISGSAPPAVVNAGRVWGKDTAPVKVEIFSDFQ